MELSSNLNDNFIVIFMYMSMSPFSLDGCLCLPGSKGEKKYITASMHSCVCLYLLFPMMRDTRVILFVKLDVCLPFDVRRWRRIGCSGVISLIPAVRSGRIATTTIFCGAVVGASPGGRRGCRSCYGTRGGTGTVLTATANKKQS